MPAGFWIICTALAILLALGLIGAARRHRARRMHGKDRHAPPPATDVEE